MPKTAKKPTALARAAKPRSPRAHLAAEPRKLEDAAAAYAGASRAENTKRAYTNVFVLFSAWCGEQGVATMPALPRTVALYLTALAVGEKKVATIERALVAISQAHKLHGSPSPRNAAEVTEVLQGIRRTLGVAPNQKDPLLIATLRALVEPMRKDDPGDARDRALLCLGFASGCRRSELVALDIGDLSFGDDGLEITIRRSKTDQEGLGRKVGIPYGGRPRTCPVRAVRDWLDLSLLAEGPLFRPVNRFGKILPKRLTDQSVALIVKRWALEAGLDPALFAGHSLRSGLATAAAKAGKSERSIMKQTGHRSVSVVRRYIRDAELFEDNAAAGIMRGAAGEEVIHRGRARAVMSNHESARFQVAAVRLGRALASTRALLVLTLTGCAWSETPTADKQQLDAAKAALAAARVADVEARTKQIANCSAALMIWPETGYIYEKCPDDRQPSFINEWRPARPSEIAAFAAAGGIPVREWEGRTASTNEAAAHEPTSPLFYTTLMTAVGSKPEVWGIFQSTDKSSSQKRCNHARDLLVKDLPSLSIPGRPAFYCLPVTDDVAK